MSQQFPRIYSSWMVAGLVVGLVASCSFEQPMSTPVGSSHERSRMVQGGMMPPTASQEQVSMPSLAATAVTISEQNLRFNPATVTVPVGTTVTWINNDPQGRPHTSTSDTGLWDSGNMAVGQSYSYTFNQPGTFPYHCMFHQAEGMTGTIVVQ